MIQVTTSSSGANARRGEEPAWQEREEQPVFITSLTQQELSYWSYKRIYMVRQFNSRNGTVKAKFAYLCTIDCCRLRNTLLAKLCTSWDDGATSGNSLQNRFTE